MKNKILLAIIIFLIFAASLAGLWQIEKQSYEYLNGGKRGNIERIISLSPSVTEVLFDLGLGNKIVGVTDFCKYPPEALKIKNIGGYLDANFEAIIALKPDLVILRKEFQRAQERLNGLGVKTLIVNHDDINGIIDSYLIIGKACGANEAASEKASELRQRIQKIKAKTKDLPGRKVLICVERGLGTGSINGVIAAGNDGFYDEMVSLAGGTCLFQKTGLPFPKVSAESIIGSNPDIIIDIIPDIESRGFSREEVIKDWQALADVRAVKEGRVHVLTQDYIVIPGPRFIMIIEEFAKLIHPEAER